MAGTAPVAAIVIYQRRMEMERFVAVISGVEAVLTATRGMPPGLALVNSLAEPLSR